METDFEVLKKEIAGSQLVNYKWIMKKLNKLEELNS